MLNETPTLAPDGLPYRLLTLRNSAGMVVTVMDWGATLLAARSTVATRFKIAGLQWRSPTASRNATSVFTSYIAISWPI